MWMKTSEITCYIVLGYIINLFTNYYFPDISWFVCNFFLVVYISSLPQILIVGEENEIPYMRPPLSKDLWFNDDKEEVESMTFKQYNGKKRRCALDLLFQLLVYFLMLGVNKFILCTVFGGGGRGTADIYDSYG